jgi:chromosome segregation ATPase
MPSTDLALVVRTLKMPPNATPRWKHPEHAVKLFSQRTAKLEAENRILTEAARQRARRVEELESECQTAREAARVLQSECQTAREAARVLQSERDFYSKRASEFEEHNRQLTDAATEYSLRAQGLERELVKLGTEFAERNRQLTDAATEYSLRAQGLERELVKLGTECAERKRQLTEAATKYSLRAQELERELAAALRAKETADHPNNSPAAEDVGQ